MYETEESEVEVEKKQLALLHQQRVQAELDDRKRRMLDVYIEAIDNDYDDEEEADVSLVSCAHDINSYMLCNIYAS